MYYPINFDNNGSSFSVINTGTAPTPCKLIIIPKVDMVSLVITGLSKDAIEISSVPTGSELVIDGETGRITLDENDYFDHFNGWEFPKLQPGTNNIQISNGSQATVQIEFNARYI